MACYPRFDTGNRLALNVILIVRHAESCTRRVMSGSDTLVERVAARARETDQLEFAAKVGTSMEAVCLSHGTLELNNFTTISVLANDQCCSRTRLKFFAIILN